MDALSEILQAMEMRQVALGTLHLGAPWGFRQSDFSVPTIFGLVSGPNCWLRLPNRTPVELAVGDVALLPTSTEVCLSSTPDGPCENIGEVWDANHLPRFPWIEPLAPLRCVWGGDGPQTVLLGLAFQFLDGGPGALIEALPDLTLIRSAQGKFPWILPAVDFLAREDAQVAGYTFTARLLAELMFVSILRHQITEEHVEARQGWLRGLTDPAVAASLQAIHASPSTDWTVRSLADTAGVSRTVLATRFAELVGVPPIQYLARWRMYLAARRLLNPKVNLSQIAFQLGYASDAAFRSMFRRYYGKSPSEYRDAALR